MKLLDRLFGRRPRQPTDMEQAGRILHRFTTATIMGVDREDIGRYPHKQHKVMAFHYGAIEVLSDEFGFDETRSLALFVMFVDRYFNMPVTETGSVSERIQGFHENRDEMPYLMAGRDVFTRWHSRNERRAPLELGEMLKNT